MASSWEDPQWGNDDMPALGLDLESYEYDYDNVLESEAALELYDYIVRLKQMSVISAKQAQQGRSNRNGHQAVVQAVFAERPLFQALRLHRWISALG